MFLVMPLAQDALTVLLLAYGYAEPQQTLLAEQMRLVGLPTRYI